MGAWSKIYKTSSSVDMKEFFKKNRRNIFIISGLSLFISLFNISRVIYSALAIPKGSTYLAVGHYYEDYFEYVQQIAQGIFGHAMIGNQFTVFDPTQTLIGWWPYLFIGKVAGFLGFSPFLAYWVSVFLLTFVFCIVLFYLIRLLLPRIPFFFQAVALLFSVFAVPFVQSMTFRPVFSVQFYDFWYAPITLFQRIGATPHHMVGLIAVTLSFIVFVKLISMVQEKKFRSLNIYIFFLTGLLLLVLTTEPLHAVTLISTIAVISIVWFIRLYKKYGFNKHVRLFMWAFLILFAIVGPAGVALKFAHGSGELFQRAMFWESAQNSHVPVILIIKTLGPIILLVPFGIVKFIKSATPARLTTLVFVVFSYLYYASPVASLLGTFNQRFLTPYTYVLFSCIAIEYIFSCMKKSKAIKLFMYSVVTVLLLYFILGSMMTDVSFFNTSSINYLPSGVIDGFNHIQNTDKKAVLTSPSASLGMIVPVFIDRKVYLGRTIFTPDFEIKQMISDSFYKHALSDEDAEKLLRSNNIGYIVLASSEPYSRELLRQYPFLSEFYENSDVAIFSYEK